MLERRKLLSGLLCAPLVVRDYSVLMPVKMVILPPGWREWPIKLNFIIHAPEGEFGDYESAGWERGDPITGSIMLEKIRWHPAEAV